MVIVSTGYVSKWFPVHASNRDSWPCTPADAPGQSSADASYDTADRPRKWLEHAYAMNPWTMPHSEASNNAAVDTAVMVIPGWRAAASLA